MRGLKRCQNCFGHIQPDEESIPLRGAPPSKGRAQPVIHQDSSICELLCSDRNDRHLGGPH